LEISNMSTKLWIIGCIAIGVALAFGLGMMQGFLAAV
jgi:type IV secretory pathway VirB2 component (pilin)